MNFPGLAAAFVDRVAAYAPAGIELVEEPKGFVRVWADESRWESFAIDEPDVEEEVDEAAYDPPYPAFAVLEALDFLQEFLRNELEREWEDGEPWAELDEDEIRFGYEGGPPFDPIALSSLG